MICVMFGDTGKKVRPCQYRLSVTLSAVTATLLFLGIGLCFVTRIGIENDEALFSMALFQPFGGAYVLRFGHSQFTLMLMTYLGGLKALIYLPIFQLFGTGVLTLRVPMVVAGAASVWLFFLLLRRIAGERAAIIGCWLLTVDSAYLITICFDWGPVALQHLLLLGGCLLLIRFYQERRHISLFWGCFLLGLGLWDKALALWMLSGIGIAVLAVFPREIASVVTKRRILLSVLGLALGALPLLIYNLQNHWVTFIGNFQRDTSNFSGKARLLMNTASGDGLFGMFNEAWNTPTPRQAAGLMQDLSARISTDTGHPRRHLLFYAFLLALLLAPLARGHALRAIAVGAIALLIAWVLMAITAGAGGSVHHTILLWPLPHMVIGISFAAASRKLRRFGLPVLLIVATAAVVSGALVTNEYYYAALRYGGSRGWTDGIVALADAMKRVPAERIYCVDWGMLDTLRLLDHGTLPLVIGPLPKRDLGSSDRDAVGRLVDDSGAVFIAHTKAFEEFPGVNQRFAELAAESGHAMEVVTRVSDSFGMPAYEVYRFTKGSIPLDPK